MSTAPPVAAPPVAAPVPDPGPPAGDPTAELVAADRAVLIHPALPAHRADRTVLVRGSGCRVWDSEGRSYLDGSAVLGLSQVGHGRRELADAASAQMATLDCFHTWGTITNDRAVELARRLVGLAPNGLDHVYFTSGGAEGVEVALRMARFAHHRNGEPDRTWVLSRRLGYHGIGYGSGSVSGLPAYHEGFGPGLPHVHHLSPPHPYQRHRYTGADVTGSCLRELTAVIERIGGDRIAAMIGEPVMGGGGAVTPPPDYWPRVAELLRSHGILLIFDEVVSAYGRTGRWFAAEHFGVTPDILVTAKGITSGYVPHGAVLTTGEVADALCRDSGFPAGFTYTGHPTACAVALANLDLIEREDLLGNAVETGAHLAARLRECLDLPVVGDVRGLGLMLAVEVVADKHTRDPLPGGTAHVADALRTDAGILLRVNPHALVINPPLVLTRAEADELADGIHAVLRRVRPDGSLAPA
ncbi:aminotransferase family protein [Saccharothrix luteola]|uniref:aminotransferase family protein n=1 Tax=Saccharothrix luteola TaxID=2893018 RepID=UPI001E3AFB2C|nr:aspartate aminotransferase family protein [Saccharothrix luteola]MCC8246434.1 aspartate aminotransferase family protein [Saccharothrix luteola]